MHNSNNIKSNSPGPLKRAVSGAGTLLLSGVPKESVDRGLDRIWLRGGRGSLELSLVDPQPGMQQSLRKRKRAAAEKSVRVKREE